MDPVGNPGEEGNTVPGEEREIRSVRLEDPSFVRYREDHFAASLQDSVKLIQSHRLINDVFDYFIAQYYVD
jgi:hypothetical protein